MLFYMLFYLLPRPFSLHQLSEYLFGSVQVEVSLHPPLPVDVIDFGLN